MTGPEQQPLIVVAHGFRKHDHDITIAVAEDRSALNAGLQRFQLLYGTVSMIVLMVLLVIQGLIVRSGLRPLDDVQRSMEKLARGEVTRIEPTGPQRDRTLDRAIESPAVHDEQSLAALA